MNIYYVYMYLREDGTPYYVGKGKNNRAYDRHTNVHTPEFDRIIIVDQYLSESVAYELERSYIAQFGRIINATGILLNKSPGRSGIISVPHKPLILPEIPYTNGSSIEDLNESLNKLLVLYRKVYNDVRFKSTKTRFNNAIFELTKTLHTLLKAPPKPKIKRAIKKPLTKAAIERQIDKLTKAYKLEVDTNIRMNIRKDLNRLRRMWKQR